jgi:hypothetical protein
MTNLTASDAIALASKHTHVNSSAQLRFADAVNLWMVGKEEQAKDAAIDSLAHSVGVFHPDYKLTVQK